MRPEPGRADVHACLAFPDLYPIGMSHLGMAVLYYTLNRLPGVLAERIFMPEPDLESLLRFKGLPLTTLETGTPLSQLDILGFTLAYELSYTNVLAMLDLGGIPLRSEQRAVSHPLILGGGPCAFNPEPMSAFIDAFVIGEAEFRLPEICRLFAAWKKSRQSRDSLLKALARLPGVYVPSQVGSAAKGGAAGGGPGESVRKCTVPDLDTAPYPDRPIVPFSQIVHDRVSIEVARGCPHGCRFCQAGILYRPYRERSASRVEELAWASLKSTGYADLSLMSLSIGDYSELMPLASRLMEKIGPARVALSLPSIRVGSLEPSIVKEILKVRRTGFTLAPEAASPRLRGVINKDIDEEEMFRTARLLAQHGWRTLKLYFMIGLPTEQDGDLEALIRLAGETLRAARIPKGNSFQVTVNISTFVPKPHTPFQWDPQISRLETERKLDHLKKKLKRSGFRLKWHDSRLSLLEGIFARGDRSLGALVEEAYRHGCRLDGWSEHLRFDLWQQALEKSGVSAEERLRQGFLPNDPLPWNCVDPGVSREFLALERQRAASGELTPLRCSGNCAQCRICGFGDQAVEQAARPLEPAVSSPSGAGLPCANTALSATLGEVTVSPQPNPAAGAVGTRIRFGYCKTRPASWLSHLETLNVFQRALRRCALPVAFTEGEHPHPRMSFSPALALGVESYAEYLDIWFSTPLSAPEASGRLNSELPQGFSIFSAAGVPPAAAALDQSIAWIEYKFTFTEPDHLPFPPAELAQALEAFRQGRGTDGLPGEPAPQDRVGLHLTATLEPIDSCLGFRCRLHRTAGNIPSPFRLLEALFPGISRAALSCQILKIRTAFVETVNGTLSGQGVQSNTPASCPGSETKRQGE